MSLNYEMSQNSQEIRFFEFDEFDELDSPPEFWYRLTPVTPVNQSVRQYFRQSASTSVTTSVRPRLFFSETDNRIHIFHHNRYMRRPKLAHLTTSHISTFFLITKMGVLENKNGYTRRPKSVHLITRHFSTFSLSPKMGIIYVQNGSIL